MSNRPARNPRPRVTYAGKTYALRSAKTEIPDLDAMGTFEALAWILQNTVPRGYSRPKAQLPPVTLRVSSPQ